MLSDSLFQELVKMASLAPSADNMQAWSFKKIGNSIEVYAEEKRMLPMDIHHMFTQISIGAAIQNIFLKAEEKGLECKIQYAEKFQIDKPIVYLTLREGLQNKMNLTEWIPKRSTNRKPYQDKILSESQLSMLAESIIGIDAKMQWTTKKIDFKTLAKIDANTSYIRIEHKPFHKELYDILRFSDREMKLHGFGLNAKSLGIPPAISLFAKKLKNWKINQFINRFGAAKMNAKLMAKTMKNAGAYCFVSTSDSSLKGYLEAGRAIQQLWLKANSEGLSVHPYGVLPQYLTRLSDAPSSFLPHHIEIIKKQKERFVQIFPSEFKQSPALLLRIGYTNKDALRSDTRLNTEQLIRH
ncbi:hypothetical protein [Sediminitomix flava]|uniref:Nitroreductase family protein n=1 Tax=Sediminitomix flava TaxID=379075 RepID=A0A315Z830_SEDFL|nr:hypothetical protein [Sediminitomix flava]PWJ40906.1 hypothetical protein BC781_104172 [Sediminitomix flava]